MKHYQVHFHPDDITVTIHHGATLFEAAGVAGIAVTTPCGGIGRCGKCKVRLIPSEKDVLACQYVVERDLEVLVPSESRFFKQKILEHGIDRRMDWQPSMRKIHTPAAICTGIDAFCEALSTQINEQLIIKDGMNDQLISTLPEIDSSGLTAILRPEIETLTPGTPGLQLVSLETGDTTDKFFGLAVDIGTTTVVGQLVNLKTSEVVTTVSASNPQVQFGADVISRISFSEQPDDYEKLNTSIIRCLNELIEEAVNKAGIETNSIYELVAAGNTTMNHLLLKFPVVQLGQAPYRAHWLLPTDQAPTQMGLNINPAGNVHTIANIAGFIGSDTVAATLACGLDATDSVTLLVDIGTNGEIVFGTKQRLLAASCAAGPALEGAGIEFGSRAQNGAIESVIIEDDDIDVDVIGGADARTICGSGLIDAIAVMLDLEIIESTGRFCEPDELDPMMSGKIRNRITEYQNAPAFVLSGSFENGQWQNAVMLTQKDVRQFQLAKAAIFAGISLLIKASGYKENQIQQLFLAGAFGNYIRKDNAVRVGLLPDIGLEKIHFVGNAAGSGAQLVLNSQSARQLAASLARQIEYLEIAHQTEFQMIFSECLLFPEK